MASEELQQRKYLETGELRGDTFGSFEQLNLGATRLDALVQAGLSVTLPDSHSYVCAEYKAPYSPAALKPDVVSLQRRDETFVLMDDNKTLGSLLQPPIDSVDIILTNPPYVTRGSAIYKDTIKTIAGTRNGKMLKDYYDRAGLGVEALFIRYISGALKPGGRAFVIVPQGLLNRTEAGPKQQLLDECNLLASIQLPRNTFFNTAQKTYILVLERRHTAADPRPDVLCGLARSIGETLDWRRTPTPDDNDLADIAEAFVAGDNADNTLAETSPVIKVVPASSFTPDGGFLYEEKLFTTRLKELSIGVPVDEAGEFDFEQQKKIASATKRFDAIVSRLTELGRWSSEARIV